MQRLPGRIATLVVSCLTPMVLSGPSTATMARGVGTPTTRASAKTSSERSVLAANAVNDPPTIAPIADPLPIDEDAGQQTVAVSGISAGGGDSQSLVVTASSDNTALIPDPSVTYTSGDATATLKYTPVPNRFGTAVVSVAVLDAEMGETVRTFTVVVNPMPDPPSATSATTRVQEQSSSGLVITPNVVDTEVAAFKITNIRHGTLFQHNGTTPIADGAYITVAQAADGLTFTPAPGFAGEATFDVQATVDTDPLSTRISAVTTATIAVTQQPSATTIASANPDPSDQTQPITVVYSVTGASGGPPPTGNVTVSFTDGDETCTGTVAGGQCTLVPMTAGVRDLVARYDGDALTMDSTSAAFSHTVSACSINPVVAVTSDDGSPGTLRDTVANACLGSTVTFRIAGLGPHTIVLSSPIPLGKNVTIVGAPEGVVISGNDATSLFQNFATATLDGLTLTHGSAVDGGALVNLGHLTIQNSTLSENHASNDGGAIWAAAGTVTTVVNSTISGNSAGAGPGSGVGVGGGIATTTATLDLINVTITANVAGNAGGGVMHSGFTTIANSIVAGNDALTAPNLTGAYTEAGPNLLSGNPLLGPLRNNGGPTFTRMPLAGSPALDAGDSAVAAHAGLTTDQRGFARVLDAADPDTDQTVDIGAVEADPIVEVLPNIAIDEDGLAQIVFNVGDAFTAFDSIVATSDNPALLPNDGHIDLVDNGSSWTLTLFPLANISGSAGVTVAATKTVGGVLQSSATSFTLTVNAVNDPPTLGAIANPAAIPEDAPQQTVTFGGVSAGPLEVQALTITAVSNNPSLIPDPVVSYTSPGATGSLSYTPVANKNGTAMITVTVSDGLATSSQAFTVTVTSVPEAPVVTPNLHALEDDAALMAITRSPLDGADVTHFKFTNITGGKLVRNTALLPEVPNGAFLSRAEVGSGLLFMPTPDSIAAGHVTVQASVGAVDAGLGAPVTVDITVDPVPDVPSVTPATTPEDTQTASGLVITRNAVDGPEVSHFKILNIVSGTLYQHDGVTAIHAGDVITAAQGAAGLRFTPAPNYFGSASFILIGVLDAAGTINGNPPIASGAITVSAVADTPSVTNATTTVNTETTSGLVITRNPADGPEIGFVKVTGITGGTLYQQDGTTPIGNGQFVLLSLAQTVLRFTPLADSVTTGHFTIQASRLGSDVTLGGAPVTADIVVNPLTSTTTVATSGSPSSVGDLVTFTAAVSPAVAGASGTVQFTDGGSALGAPVPLSGGAASFSTSSLVPGLHAIAAVYSGNSLASGGIGTLGGGQQVTCPTIAIAPEAIPSGVVGVAYVQAFTRSGGLGSSALSLSGALPPGLTFDAAAATLSGIPQTGGSYPIEVIATPTNGCGAVAVNYTLLVTAGRTVLTGADAGGGPAVRRFNAIDGRAASGALTSFVAFDPLFTGGVRVAEGDVNGDGQPDYIVAAGSGGSPDVRVYDGATGALLRKFLAFDPSFRGGVFVAAGDVNGDGYADIVAGSGEGTRGRIKVFSGRDGSVLRDTFVFGPSFLGGVHVAAGDVNGDGLADPIAGTGEGAETTVTVLNGADLSVIRTFVPYPSFFGGVWVAAGDVNGDGFADVVTGAGPGGGPHVRAFDGRTNGEVLSFFAFAPTFTGGVRVAAGDVTGDGHADIIVGAGPGGSPDVRVFDGTTVAPVSAMLAYPVGFTGGVFVATAAPQHRMVIETAGSGPLAPQASSAAGDPGASSRRPTTLVGWAYVENQRDAGIGTIHVWAFEVGQSTPTFVGVATLGDPRPDVAATYGAQYERAGFHLELNALPPGTYDLVAYAQSALTGTFEVARTVRITKKP